MREVTIVELEDLRFFPVTCPICKTQVRLDMAATIPEGTDRGSFMFLNCPACRHPLDSGVRPSLNQFYEAYQRLASVPGNVVSFEVEKAKATK